MDTSLQLENTEINGLKDRVSELEQIRDDQADEIKSLKGEVEDRDEEITGLETEVKEARAGALHEQIRDLAKARGALFAGRHNEGREMLERALDETGEPWRLYQ